MERTGSSERILPGRASVSIPGSSTEKVLVRAISSGQFSFTSTVPSTFRATKILRLVGQVTVSLDGDIIDIAVNSAEALPGDMRARWARRAGRDAQTLAETIARLQMTVAQR